MFDLVVLFFSAIKHSCAAITQPSQDRRTRKFQLAILGCTTIGCSLTIAAIVYAIVFNLVGVAWVWLAITGAAFCALAAALGLSINKSEQATRPE